MAWFAEVSPSSRLLLRRWSWCRIGRWAGRAGSSTPYLAAFAAGLVLLLLTGSVVDVILRRREARRWIDLGRGAAYALDQVFFLSGIAMFQLVGAGGDAGLSPEIEFHVAPARACAVELLGDSARTPGMSAAVQYDMERAAAVAGDRLPVLLSDARWRDHALLTLLALARVQEETIARWISAFGVLGDAEGFRRVGRSFAILDRSEVVVQQLLDGAGSGAGDAGPGMTAAGAVSTVMRCWQELVRAYYQEAHYWEDRHTGASGLGLSEHPITLRRRFGAEPGPAVPE